MKLLTLINGFNKIHMWSYPERSKSVYMALIGRFAVYINIHKLMFAAARKELIAYD